MPATMPAEIAERSSDKRWPAPTSAQREQARGDLIDRLVAGGKVWSFNARDIFDCALNGDDYHGCLDILDRVLHLSYQGEDEFRLQARELCGLARSMIERFVDAHPLWIEEEAEQIAFDAEEERCA